MDFLFIVIALVIAITIHEFSHAWTANLLGDPTARLAGRVSLNPLKHLDPIGTLLIFIVQIGWGKPVPVNPGYFKNQKRDGAITALAGPASNLLVAIILAVPLIYYEGVLLAVTVGGVPVIYNLFGAIVDMSIVLFAFNMLPLPPLDGSKIISFFVPKRFENTYEDFLSDGIKYFLLFLVFDRFVIVNILGFSFLGQFIGTIFTFVKSIIFLGL